MDHRSLRREAESDHLSKIRRHAGGAADAREDKVMVDRVVSRGIQQHNDQLHGGTKAKLQLADGGRAEGGKVARRLDRPGRKHRDDGGSAADSAMERAVDAGLAKTFADEANKSANRARGGRSGKGHVNVIVATGSPQGQDRPVPVPVPVSAAGGAPRPPMPPPGAGIPPGAMGPGGPMMPPPGAGMPPPGLARPPMGPGGPPMMPPPGMRADGGRADVSRAQGKEVAVKETAGAASGMGRLGKMKMKIEDENADC